MKLAFVFPGQGSQHIGMVKEFYDSRAEVRAVFDEASEALGYDVAKLCFDGPEEELNITSNTQPCLLTASIAALAVLRGEGLEAEGFAGHSLGEYTALVAANSLSLTDAVNITRKRGQIMENAVPAGVGMMAAVLGLDRETVDSACAAIKAGYVAPVNYNCPGQIVISGEKAAVEAAMVSLKIQGARRVLPLSVSVPSHSKLMDGAAKELSQYLFRDDIKMQAPEMPVISNADAVFLSTVEETKAALVKQLNNPVLWEDCVATMTKAGFDTFIEVGPGKVLSGLIRRCDKEVTVLNVSDPKTLAATVQSIKGS
jgi:[acyl-carrier-protein] S-malonyltransferase